MRQQKSLIAGVRSTLRYDGALYLMLVPFIIWYLMFVYRPMGGLVIAFQDYNLFEGIGGSQWVGLKNFKEFIGGPYFARTFKNTAVIGILTMLFCYPAPIILALLINEIKNSKIKSVIQTSTFIPFFVSAVVVAGIVTNMLSPSTGIVNAILEKLTGERIYFLSEAKYFRPIYIMMTMWQNCGYNAILYLSALSAIDPQLYEACIIDGGGKMRQILHVTLPGILPTITITLITSLGGILSVGYETIILLYQPSTYETADVLSTYMYRTGIQEGNYGIASAVTIFNSIISLVFVTGANYISRKVSETSLW